MDIRLTVREIWASTLLFGSVGAALAVPLALSFDQTRFQAAAWPVMLASALFWGVLAITALWGFWDIYYRFWYPAWLRWLAPLDLLVYAAIGLGMWWLALRLPGSSMAWFIVFGGIEGVLEHIFGIYGLQILKKVPWLEGLPPIPLIIFSFFEYTLYWALVAWLAAGLARRADIIAL